MQFAVIGDVDGHAEHLKTALDAIENEGIVHVLHTGNAAWGAGGSAAIAILRERGVECVQGPRDRILARLERKRTRLERELGAEFPAYEAAHAALRSADVEWLGTMPHERRFEFDGVQVLLCHGLPSDASEYMDTHTSAQRLERARESSDAQIVASGGGHAFFSRQIGDCLLLNAPLLAGDNAAQWLRINTEAVAKRAELCLISP